VSSWAVEEPNVRLLNLAVDGEVIVFTFPGEIVETIDSSNQGPSDLVTMRQMRCIGDSIYAVGMARHAYRRVGPDQWLEIDQGVFVPRAQRTSAVGFNALAGRKGTEIYAVGYKGEIFFFDGTAWEQQASPTNIALNDVAVAPDGTVYTCGLAGTIVRGRRNQWESVTQDLTSANFWSVVVFNEIAYLSNYDGVFRLDDNVLRRVEFGPGICLDTAYLDARDGVMWSVGHKDIAFTENGVDWSSIAKP